MVARGYGSSKIKVSFLNELKRLLLRETEAWSLEGLRIRVCRLHGPSTESELTDEREMGP